VVVLAERDVRLGEDVVVLAERDVRLGEDVVVLAEGDVRLGKGVIVLAGRARFGEGPASCHPRRRSSAP
jgi:hypothetical protein